LWLANSATEWKQEFCQRSGSADDNDSSTLHRHSYSLRKLFQCFVNNRLDQSEHNLPLMHLRLLLYPLHVLVAHLCQLFNCFSTDIRIAKFPSSIFQTSSLLRFDEADRLLQRWWDLFECQTPQTTRAHVTTQSTLVLFHLINLNLYTAFKDIECFARRENSDFSGENSDLSSENSTSPYQHWIRAPEETLFHCGQVFRLICGMDMEARPIWWPAAVYRASIILWAHGISNGLTSKQRNDGSMRTNTQTNISINTLPPRDPALIRYLRCRTGNPHLTTKSGTAVYLDNPKAVLMVGMEILDCGPLTTDFCKGVIWKLERLVRSWELVHQQVSRS
jgi:hypothetical protein